MVTFGPGIELLHTDNGNRKLVESLVAQGVRFDVCLNTVDTVEREIRQAPGHHSRRHPGAGRGGTNSVAD